MASRSFLLQFIVKFPFVLGRRKRRHSPSPSTTTVTRTSIRYPDSSQDETSSLDEKQCTFVVNFNPDIWWRILSYCEVVDIIHISMTCKSLASLTEDACVWHNALLRVSHGRRLPHLRFHIRSFSIATIRKKVILSERLDRLPCGLDRVPSHYTTACLSLPVSAVWGISFLPGGEWLVVLCRKDAKDGVMICRANDPLGQPSTYSPVPGGDLNDMRIFTADEGDLLMLLRSDRPNRTRLGVYLIHPFSGSDPPKLEKFRTYGVQNFVNFTALGSYIVYGWIDCSHWERRHLIKVLKFESCYRTLTEYNTMRVFLEANNYSYSYELCITDSQITVVVSSTALVAAYNVPPMIAGLTTFEPVCVDPFWRFACNYLQPHAVYLSPSLPAADTPSIIIHYRKRILLILPNFETEPPGVHPTYFSTCAYPRDLKRPMLLGPQRAFWDLGHGRVGIGLLPAPLQPAFCDRGSLEITSSGSGPEADLGDFVHPVVYGETYNRRVGRAAWDEESGKLAMVPRMECRPESDQEMRSDKDMTIVVIVDFMH